MNLEGKILSKHSKTNCDEIVKWVGNNQSRFDQLIAHFFSHNKLIRQRAGWPLSFAAIANPAFIKKHLRKLVANLKKTNLHDAEKRNTLRLL